MQSAPDDLRRRVYSAFEGQLYDPDAFLSVASTKVDWSALEQKTVDFFNARLASVMSEADVAKVANIFYMTAPSNVANAMILRDSGEVVMVFNLSMHTLLSLYIEWFMAACEATRIHDETAMIEASSKLAQIAELGLVGYSPSLFPHAERHDLFSKSGLPHEAREMIEVCTNVAKLFVVGHEIGHFVLGHLDDDRRWQRVAPSSGVERLIESQQMEKAADAYGLDLVVRFRDVPGIGLAFALTSVFSMFAVMEFVAGLYSPVSDAPNSPDSATHPSAGVRMQMAREYIADAEDREWFEAMRQVSEFVSDFAWRELDTRGAG